ncbi:MAG: hypothetical protein EBZ48_16310, partial [Proteobacteria bacterium]|nr:hypothetical protein [Pseudomonadota bacterium]
MSAEPAAPHLSNAALRPPPERKAYSHPVVLLYLLLGGIFLSSQLLRPPTRPGRDLPSFYEGVALATAGAVDPYSIDSYTEISRQVGIKIFPFVYPPMSVPLLAPLQLGSLVEAQRWMVVL